jgi:hypothetical protein
LQRETDFSFMKSSSSFWFFNLRFRHQNW